MSCHKPRLPCRVCVHVFRFPVIVPRVGVRTRVAKGACVGLSVSSSVVCALVSGCQAGIRVSGGGCVWGFRWYGDGPGRVFNPVGAVVLRVGAAACYSPTSCRMQYHRRARSSLPGSEWVRASPLGHGRRKSVIIIPYASHTGGLWWVGDRMVDACVLKDSWCDARGVSPSSE